MDEEEFFFYCPCCGAEVSVLLDLTIRRQRYIEDCEVCCNPLEIAFTIEDEEIVEFDAQPA
jgi:transcription elongation factor Elf1